MKEEWREIKDFEGKYAISNLGRVKSLDRYYSHKGCKGGFYHRKEKELISAYDRDKYLIVTLCKNSKKYTKRIHRLVAEAFIPNPNNYPQINHKDENKDNNCADNLEWCTAKYNTNYGNRNKKSSISKYKKVYQYDINGKFIKEWESIKEAKESLKISEHIGDCCKGKRKTAGGYKWKYYKDYMTDGIISEEEWNKIEEKFKEVK